MASGLMLGGAVSRRYFRPSSLADQEASHGQRVQTGGEEAADRVHCQVALVSA
jgi:hypothetical protein